MTPDTVLVRSRDVVVRIGDADDVRIVRGEEHFEAAPHALAVLDGFAHPRSVGDFLAATTAGPQHWIELSATVLQLARAGVLLPPGEQSDAIPSGFARPTVHVVMLDDERRTSGFLAAIERVVEKGDVVVDIGTGTGVLATRAARCGAGRVFAVESSGIADAAERVFAANDVADAVTLVRGRSTQVTLPRRADVLVTEIIGNDPLDELILEVIADAKSRLLSPSARLIPSALEIFAMPLDVPRRVVERHVFTPERVTAWQTRYAMDFSPLMSVRPSPSQPLLVRTDEVLAWPRAAAPVRLASIDFTKAFDVVLQERVRFEIERDVERLGVVLAFRATLAPGLSLSTLAEDVHPENSWRYALWPCVDRLAFRRHEHATIDYGYSRGRTTLRVS